MTGPLDGIRVRELPDEGVVEVAVKDWPKQLRYTPQAWRDLHAGRTDAEVIEHLLEQIKLAHTDPEPLPWTG